MGNYATLIGESDGIIQLTTWNVGKWDGKLVSGRRETRCERTKANSG